MSDLSSMRSQQPGYLEDLEPRFTSLRARLHRPHLQPVHQPALVPCRTLSTTETLMGVSLVRAFRCDQLSVRPTPSEPETPCLGHS